MPLETLGIRDTLTNYIELRVWRRLGIRDTLLSVDLYLEKIFGFGTLPQLGTVASGESSSEHFHAELLLLGEDFESLDTFTERSFVYTCMYISLHGENFAL